MADPVTLALAGLAVSTVAQVGGAISSRVAEVDAAESNSRRAAEQAAQVAIEADRGVRQERREQYLRSGRARAIAASRGGGLDSALDQLADSSAQGALDVLAIRETEKARKDSVIRAAEAEAERVGGGMGLATQLLSIGGSAAAGYGKIKGGLG